jgi:hypothetical protein
MLTSWSSSEFDLAPFPIDLEWLKACTNETFSSSLWRHIFHILDGAYLHEGTKCFREFVQVRGIPGIFYFATANEGHEIALGNYSQCLQDCTKRQKYCNGTIT